MKTYVLTLSRTFPAYHPRKGEDTYFHAKTTIVLNNGNNSLYLEDFSTGDGEYKIHTIRSNFPLWEKRIKEVQNGRAMLSLRQWEDKPYRSKQRIICNLTKDNSIGIQRLVFKQERYTYVNDKHVDLMRLANNDGLSLYDFSKWFKPYNLSEPLAVIHFTPFRY